MSSIITIKNLTKKYGSYAALNNVSMDIKKGEIYGLIGKNGAGKSTLFRVLMGLANANEGHISILGSKNNAELNAARRNIGFMMGANYFPYLNARKNLEYYRRLRGIRDPKEVDRVLKLVDLDKVKKPFKTYSMGMKQRLSIANALMGNSDIIILDEPINGLDPQGISDFRKMIMALNEEHGITFIVSSHILGELSQMSTRFSFINKGKLIKELTNEELHEQVTTSLIIKVDNVHKATVLIEEQFPDAKYIVNEKQEVVVHDYTDKASELAHLLVTNDLHLKKLQPKETSLEEYFLELVGGHDNV